MKSEINNSEHRTLTSTAYQFGVGVLLGLTFICIPLAISAPDMTVWNITVSATVVLLCGILSALVGKRFLATFMRVLESFPPIA